MVCLDTDFLMDLNRKDQKAISKMGEFVENNELVYTTIINVAEYYVGAHRSKNKDAVDNARNYLKQFSILGLDEDSALLWGKLHKDLKSNSIGDRDLFIASIAISNKQTLITRNSRHFQRISDLKVEGW